MREVKGNLWEVPADLRCITTNGIIKKNGALVMGAGCAKEAKNKWPAIDTHIGGYVSETGNHVYIIPAYNGTEETEWIATFPTKNHWKDKSSIELITRSAVELMAILNNMNLWESPVIPRPGCGHGGLNWETEVKPVLQDIFDDRITVVTYA